MTTCGALNIKEFQQNARLTVVSSRTIAEGGIHDILTKEMAPTSGPAEDEATFQSGECCAWKSCKPVKNSSTTREAREDLSRHMLKRAVYPDGRQRDGKTGYCPQPLSA